MLFEFVELILLLLFSLAKYRKAIELMESKVDRMNEKNNFYQ